MYKKQSPIYFILQMKNMVAQAWVIIPVFLLLNSKLANTTLWLVLIVLMLVFKLIRVTLGYFNTVYRITTDDIQVNYGIFNVQSISLLHNDGILNYRLDNTWLHKIFGVQGLEIRFKNGEEQDALKFYALTPDEIDAITQRLDTSEAPVETEVVIQEELIAEIKISMKTLALTGLLSANYILVIPALLDYENILRKLHQYVSLDISPMVYCLILLGLLPAITIANQYYKFGEFKIYDEGTRFLVKNGLIDSDGHLIEKAKINGIRVDQTLGMRVLGLCSVSVVMNDQSDEDTLSKDMIFPYIRLSDLEPILAAYLPAYAGQFKHVPLRFNLTKGLYAATLIAVVVGTMIVFSWPFWAYMIVLAIAGMMLLPALTTFSRSLDKIVIRRGLLNIETYIIPVTKVGVSSKTNIANLVKIEHVYTDLTPSHHFKQLH